MLWKEIRGRTTVRGPRQSGTDGATCRGQTGRSQFHQSRLKTRSFWPRFGGRLFGPTSTPGFPRMGPLSSFSSFSLTWQWPQLTLKFNLRSLTTKSALTPLITIFCPQVIEPHRLIFVLPPNSMIPIDRGEGEGNKVDPVQSSPPLLSFLSDPVNCSATS